jgi:hypothetical protein
METWSATVGIRVCILGPLAPWPLGPLARCADRGPPVCVRPRRACGPAASPMTALSGDICASTTTITATRRVDVFFAQVAALPPTDRPGGLVAFARDRRHAHGAIPADRTDHFRRLGLTGCALLDLSSEQCTYAPQWCPRRELNQMPMPAQRMDLPIS